MNEQSQLGQQAASYLSIGFLAIFTAFIVFVVAILRASRRHSLDLNDVARGEASRHLPRAVGRDRKGAYRDPWDPGYRLARAGVFTLGVIGLVSLAIGSCVIGTGRWGSIVSIAWVIPGTSFMSVEFALFLATAVAFMWAAVEVLSRPVRGLLMCGAAFLLSLGSIYIAGPGPASESDAGVALLFFVTPASFFIVRGLQLRQQIVASSG